MRGGVGAGSLRDSGTRVPRFSISRHGYILWPRWAARIGVTRSHGGVLTADRQCTE